MSERIKNWILPLLFGSSVAHMIIKCYHNADAFALSCVFFAYALLCFMVFELIRKTKRFSGIIYMILFGVVIFAGVRILVTTRMNGLASLSFNNWFYGAQTAETIVPAYTFVLFFSGGFFLISILYYFTQVIYRAFGTMLIMFFPLFIYAKRLDTIPSENLVVILAFYLAILVHNRQMKSEKSSIVIMNKAYLASIGLFVVAVSLITAILPKPNVIAVQEEDDSFFENLVSAPDDFSDRSSLTGGRLSDEILFYVESDQPLYLRRQAYDDYVDGNWVVDNDDPMANKLPKNNDIYVLNTSYVSYIQALYQSSINQAEDGEYSYPEIDFELPEKETITIRPTDNFTPYYVPLPLNTLTIDGTHYQKLLHGEYKPLEGSSWLKLGEITVEYYPYAKRMSNFLSQLNYDYDEMLDIIGFYEENFSENEELSKKYSNMYTDTEYVSQRFTDFTEASDELYDLANQITAGLSSPYEKAKALEGYFEEENFTYDVDVYPDDVDDFVFNVQTGACGYYATAMTLMARASGLHARYVEGFVVSEEHEEQDGVYVVREYHSHAYVEVFINGVGWVVFDPTVDGYLDFYETLDQESFLDYLKKYIPVVIAVAAVLVVAFLLRKQILEAFFLVRICFADKENTVILCYNRIVKLYSEKIKLSFTGKTSEEISKLLLEKEIEASAFIKLFEKTCYAHREVSADEKKFCKLEYKRIKRSIRKLKINY